MITSIEEMMRQGGAAEVQISGWNGERDITVMLKRPSLYAMAAAGHIPNPLLPVADGLFMANGATIQKSRFDETAKMIELIAKEALVKPTFDELTEAGLMLTDQQYNEIYAYVLRGPVGLDRFRKVMRGAAGTDVAHDVHKGVEPAGHR